MASEEAKMKFGTNDQPPVDISESHLQFFKKVKESAAEENFGEKLCECVDEISRVTLFRKSFKWCPTVQENRDAFSKNSGYSTRLRETANLYYKDKNFEQALRGYNLAIVYAPPSIKNSSAHAPGDSALALAFANRSAVSISLEKLESALNDIGLAIQYGYPEKLKEKLSERQIYCEKLLANQKESISANILAQKEREKYKKEILFKIRSNNPKAPVAENFVEIRINPLRGRQLVVTKEVSPGTVLIVEEPYVKVLQKELKWDFKNCHFCLKELQGGIPCQGCVFAMYCDQTCAKTAWGAYHNYECPCMPFLHISKSSAYSRMAFRIICIIGPEKLYQMSINSKNKTNSDMIAGCDPITGIYDSTSYLPIHNLISHSAALSPAEKFSNTLEGIIFADRLDQFTDFYDAKIEYQNQYAKSEFKDYVASSVLHCLERVSCNGISLPEMSQGKCLDRSKKRTEIGGALYSLCSLLNHSCCPNVTRVHDLRSGKMAIVATATLKPGDELLTTYSKIFYDHDFEERQEYLQTNFNFKCDCEACENKWPILVQLSKIPPKFLCQKCHSSAIIDTNGICPNCGIQNDMLKLVEKFNQNVKVFHEADKLILQNSPIDAIKRLESCLEFFQSAVANPFDKFVMSQDLMKQALDLVIIGT